jgi:hypothetical protein
MGNYEIASFNARVQHLIQESKIDDGNGIIEADKGELAKLLFATEVESVEELLGPAMGQYSMNSEQNLFLKQYIEQKAQKNGVEINVNVSSPKEYSKEFRELLTYVRTNIYGACVNHMFDLLDKEPSEALKIIENAKISQEDKDKLLELKALYDQYYNVNLMHNGKAYNLLEISENEIAALEQSEPEVANFIKENKDDIKNQAIKFTRKELEKIELAEAGKNSKDFVPTLLGILGFSTAIGLGKTAYENYKIKKDWSGYIAEQRVLKHRKITVQNPFKEISSKIKGAKGKWQVAAALMGIVGMTLMGSFDDLSGCFKDYKQDKDNFGKKRAGILAGLSALWGITTSFLIAPTVDTNAEINRARKVVNKEILNKVKANGRMGLLKAVRRNMQPTFARRALKFGKAGLVAGGIGVLIAACSSGSSHASMVGTRYLFAKNADDLESKNLIDKSENTGKAANENMMKYEAYKGKWRGIAVGPTSDPTIGFTFGATGLLASANPYVSAAAFSIQGCSETLTACGYQLFGDKSRGSELEKEKQALVEAV